MNTCETSNNMGEHRIAVNKMMKRRFVPVTTSLPSILHNNEVSLFDKYMPQLSRQQLTRSNNGININNTPVLPKDTQNDEFNRRYYFWKDETGNNNGNTDTYPSVTTIQNENSNPIVEIDLPVPAMTRHVSFSSLDTTIKINDAAVSSSPTEENTTIMSGLSQSILTGSKFKGTYYAFLMSHTVRFKKKDTNIGVSRYPIFSVIAHNNQARTPEQSNPSVLQFPIIFDKDTAAAAPFWRLNTTIGTFFTRLAAEKCCHEWVQKTRGTTSKQDKAPVLAKKLHKSLYSSQKPINMPIERFLYENNAPPQYIRACQAIKTECRDIIVK